MSDALLPALVCPRCLEPTAGITHDTDASVMRLRCRSCAFEWSSAKPSVFRPSPRARFRHGDHVCGLYDSPEQQMEMAVTFIAEGVRLHERCLYTAPSAHDLTRFRDRLHQEDIDATEAVDQGALVLLRKDEAHLFGGTFDSDRMLRMLNAGVKAALDDGYTAFRACGDMTWLLDEAPGSSQVTEYEALVTHLFSPVRGLVLCQYDRSRLPAQLIGHALTTHTLVIKPPHQTA